MVESKQPGTEETDEVKSVKATCKRCKSDLIIGVEPASRADGKPGFSIFCPKCEYSLVVWWQK